MAKFKRYNIVGRLKDGAQRKAEKIGQTIRTKALLGMAGSKSGHQYRVPGTKRTYTASAPGEYPAIRTGQLRAGIQMATQVGFTGAFAIIGTNVKHGLILEGTKSNPGIRPWLSRAARESETEIRDILKEKWL